MLGWQTYLLTCMTDIISEWKNPSIMKTGDTQDVYYYGMPGAEHDQYLFSIKERNTRGTFLTSVLSCVLSDRGWFIIKRNNFSADPKGHDNIMKLIEHCCVENKWDSLSFFNNNSQF